jgi:hypothetical protein
MHRRPLQPLQLQHLLSNRRILQKRNKILFIHLRWCLHNSPSSLETTGWWNRFNPASNRFMTAFHKPSSATSPARYTAHQDLKFNKRFPLFPGHSTQWRSLLPKGGGLIQVDIGGHPPIPNSNWLILTIFSSTCFSVMGTFLCNCGFCTFGVVLNPYTTSRWIMVAAHLFQLACFGIFHVSTSFCTSRDVLGH